MLCRLDRLLNMTNRNDVETVTMRDGSKVFAKFNAKHNKLESVLYANSTQATARVQQLRGAGIDAGVKRYHLSRVFYVQIFDTRCEGDSQCKKSPVRGSKFCADHIAFSDDQETK